MIDTKQSIEWLKQFSEYQIDQIICGLQRRVDVSLYANPKFNWIQMKLFRTGLEHNVDVSFYVNLGFNDSQVLELCKGITSGVDISLYARLEFDEFQMEQIRLGQVNGVDVSFYLNSDFDWEQMQEIRMKLEKQKQELDSKIAHEPLDDGKLYRIKLGDYYIGLSKPDNKIHIAYNSEDTKYYQRIFTLPQIYQLDSRLIPLAVEVEVL